MSREILSIKNLSAGYENVRVIHDLSVQVCAGSFVSLIGPNGSGKTTLLRTLAGLMNYSGSVMLNGQELRTFRRKYLSRSVAFAMSAKNFLRSESAASFSVHDVIAMGRLPHFGLFASLSNHDRDIIYSSAHLLGITSILKRKLHTLSDGQRQLALLASAIAQDTPVILLDEPTSSLDPDTSAQIFSLLRDLCSRGKTIIAAVHDINASMHYSHSYIALKNGVLISRGHELKADTLTLLYGCMFEDYTNVKEDDVMWRALPE